LVAGFDFAPGPENWRKAVDFSGLILKILLPNAVPLKYL
jgi:hypothetical protein